MPFLEILTPRRTARRATLQSALAIGALLLLSGSAALCADERQETGVTDTEIKIGNLMPYSGPASVYSIAGKVEAAYFRKLNEEGGINGRKVNFISYDDSFSPPKAVEQTRRLVENDSVFAIFGSPSTAANTATMKYLNQRKVPQIFVASGAAKFDDPEHFPWTMAFIPRYRSEGAIYGRHILAEAPNTKIAILYQNDDFGRDYLAGLLDGLGKDGPRLLVARAPYETTDATVVSLIANLKASGADALVIAAISKFATQAIRAAAELSWRPKTYVSNVSTTIDSALKPAGLENAVGILSAAYRKDPEDPMWADDPGMRRFMEFMDKFVPGAPKNDTAALGYASAQAMAHILQKCGRSLTRESFMRQAASLDDVEIDLLLPGIKLTTSSTNYAPINQFQMTRFDGKRWLPVGNVERP